MAYDFKKEQKQFYLPPQRPQIVDIPEMRFVAVRGQGDPNDENGEFPRALPVLYTLAYTLKMSKMGGNTPEGYFDFVVPPLEGFWHQESAGGIDYARKDLFRWVAAIRLPDFVTEAALDWAKGEALRKKGLDCGRAEFLRMREGLCVQMLHAGPYDLEPASVRDMTEFAASDGYRMDYTDARRHHEIYLSDPRRTAPDKLKTVLRLPVAPRNT